MSKNYQQNIKVIKTQI